MAITRRRRRGVGRKLKRRIMRFGNEHAYMEKFNRRSRGIVLRALKVRLPKSSAAELAGVTTAQLRLWLKKGLELEGDRSNPMNSIFTSFRRKVKAIEAGHEADALKRIGAAAEGGGKITETKVRIKSLGQIKEREIIRTEKTLAGVWQADAWWLERTRRKMYGRDAVDEQAGKTPEEAAADIKSAADTLFNSVPLEAGDWEARADG